MLTIAEVAGAREERSLGGISMFKSYKTSQIALNRHKINTSSEEWLNVFIIHP
jgi:hypothetical protein